MPVIDMNQLENLILSIKRMASDCEESWYLLKSISGEMESEPEFMSFFEGNKAWEHINAGIEPMERFKDILYDLSLVLTPILSQYEEWNERYSRRMEQIGEYLAGLGASSEHVLSKEYRQKAEMAFTGELAAVHWMLKREYRFGKVRKEHE